MKTILRAFLILVMTALLGCEQRDTYRPVYYPDQGNLTTYTRGPKFDNVAQARQWANDHHRQSRHPNWDYEIGKNCKPFENTDIEICAETLK